MTAARLDLQSLACPLCALPVAGHAARLVYLEPSSSGGNAADARRCARCGLELRLPRAPFGRALDRRMAGRTLPRWVGR